MTRVLKKFLDASSDLYCDLLEFPVDNVRNYRREPLNAEDKVELTKLIKTLDEFRVLAERMITDIGHKEHVKKVNSDVK